MVEFGGWDMPVQYAGILSEARAVRGSAGMFDVSHMGRLVIEGPGAAKYLDRVLSVDVPKLRVGRARYGVVCNESGGIIDDCIVYRLGEIRYLLVPNAANTPAVKQWLARWSPPASEAATTDVTGELSMIALQGPGAIDLLGPLVDADISGLRPFALCESRIDGVPAHHRQNRIYGGGRRGVLRTLGGGRGNLGDSGREGFCALRTGRARRTAPRGRAVAPRQRHGRYDESLRGGPGPLRKRR